jgi:hypothetical protein
MAAFAPPLPIVDSARSSVKDLALGSAPDLACHAQAGWRNRLFAKIAKAENQT